ncbi:transcriptional regulator [Bacteroides thetaiotaomicron]|uniref:Transcriptional regulator n=1 Tax=Bacteroides thetaiotaomicron (strain ATCC 29148 / DSM 2079 / JCM 5827 / CCUG 10774 / NCTC 10582 / VPI-5482 / E50) TaxID=226186 RepID=Q8AAT8_BACTN|nr:UpxY family transcription antiterminator [Bacteroides thetaiotaomicron]AAO75483.1 putative transcriptional regulator [Bacteroides thetaiotaomicron VPI-5482]MBI0306172.1 UpxY family transcription antiterminator [Bacteroides thetaiotaomicron]MBM6520876.1 UpxY family transcription antiterminator [Bacteroides thetaiotaomicron]MCS2629474.1 UpxY family transcription antiterminator [Bacteroides thetaiotaomicron]MCS2827555.1 UpxY family transcription antiterminator [Bacteroides thetaiotaomicron]
MILTKEKSAILGTKNGTGEGVACLKRWYVAHVRIHHEKKVAEYLGKMGIETFVPVQQEIHQWSDRRKLVETVLLPMMVFVHADPKERMAALTLATVSRYMVLRGEGKPAVIPDDQMASFRFMLDYSEEAICMNYSPLARGKKVRVIKGPLTGLVGELVALDGKSKIAVRLDMLGCACVDMPIGYVEQIGERN